MTVIAWDGTTLAADKRVDIGGTSFTGTKVRRVGDALVAFAGTGSQFLPRMEWYAKGAKKGDEKSIKCLRKLAAEGVAEAAAALRRLRLAPS